MLLVSAGLVSAGLISACIGAKEEAIVLRPHSSRPHASLSLMAPARILNACDDSFEDARTHSLTHTYTHTHTRHPPTGAHLSEGEEENKFCFDVTQYLIYY